MNKTKIYSFIIGISIFSLTGCVPIKYQNNIESKEYPIVKAEEAKKVSQSIPYKSTEEIIIYLNRRINDNMKNGMFNSYTYNRITNESAEYIRNYYESNGYKVIMRESGVNPLETYIEVSWK